jgi:hypothetical protein
MCKLLSWRCMHARSVADDCYTLRSALQVLLQRVMGELSAAAARHCGHRLVVLLPDDAVDASATISAALQEL